MDVFLLRSSDKIVSCLQHSTEQHVLEEDDESVGRIVELSRLAHVAKERGELETALQYEREAYRLCSQLSDQDSGGFGFPSLIAAKLYNMGQLHYWMEEFEEAKLCFEQARELDAYAGNLVGEAASVRSLGFLRQEADDFSDALELHKQALRLDHQAGFEHGIAVNQANIGAIYLELGDSQQALRYLEQALGSFEAWDQVEETERVKQLMQTAESQLT
jgi:tetratricopeptide (TPR) repeat protein